MDDGAAAFFMRRFYANWLGGGEQADAAPRMRDVLRAFGYDISEASAEDFKRYKILLRQYDLPLDIHPFVTGDSSFQDVWSRRVMSSIGKIEAPFACLDDIIHMKRAAGRPKDIEDLRQLEKLRDQGAENPSD